MTTRWGLLLIPPFIVSFMLVVASQYVFLESSFFKDLGMGRIGDEFNFDNYTKFLTDSFFLYALWTTVKTSALATLFTMLLGFPVAYMIARMRSRWVMVLIAGVVIATFVTIVIKVYGLIVIFSANGLLNTTLVALGIISEPFTIFGNVSGVVVGLMHFTLGFGVLLLYSVIQTIPLSLEDAAQIHGASRWRVYKRVIFPLALSGVITGSLMIFNMCMGAFTSAALLGGGRIFTLPVLVQRVVMMELKFSMGATLAAILLVSVVIINLLSVFVLKRMRATHMVVV
jgi:putative spermidine/putrescine transport system permease protein